MSGPAVYKPTVTRPLPAGAEIFEEAGQPFARWQDSRGRPRTAPVRVLEKGPCAGQRRIVIESPRYVVRYRDAAGVIRTVATDCRDEAAARRVLDQLLKEVKESPRPAICGGGAGPAPAGESSFRADFSRYLASLRDRGTPAGRLAEAERLVRRIARQCRFRALSDLSGQAVQQWLADRQAEGMPPDLRNAHLDSLMDFVEWCLAQGRLSANPLKGVGRSVTQVDGSPRARPLSEPELRRLLAIALWRPLAEYGRASAMPTEAADAASGSHFDRLTVQSLEALVLRGREQLRESPGLIERLERQGWHRAMIYKTLALTGLRRSELVSLVVGSLRLKGAEPHILIGAMPTEGVGGLRAPLRADLAKDLRQWLALRWRAARRVKGRSERSALRRAFLEQPLFKLPAGLAKLLAIDLKAAGIGEVDEQGVRIDPHARRQGDGRGADEKGILLARLRAEILGRLSRRGRKP